MIVGPNGRPVQATDGPTGREVHLVEIMKEGKLTWGLAPVGGAFDKLEVIQVLTIAAHGVATQCRAEMHHMQSMAEVKAKMHDLQNKEK